MKYEKRDERVQSAQSGDLSVYRKIIADGCSNLYIYAAVIKEKKKDAVELMKQTYLTAWMEKSKIRESEKIDIWLKGVMCRIALPKGRKGSGRTDFREDPIIDKMMRTSLSDAERRWYLNENEQRTLCSDVINEIKNTTSRSTI